MQTSIIEKFLSTENGIEAEKILRSCVHCGFCTATCPTYQLLGDELDSPRGRIYLVKQLLEGKKVSHISQQHLDRCLTCRSCETTCPSGVEYAKLIDIGRELIEEQVARPRLEQLKRYLLRKILPYPNRLKLLVNIGQSLKLFLPQSLCNKIPSIAQKRRASLPVLGNNSLENKIQLLPVKQRKMLILAGCAQSALTPKTNEASHRVLEILGISLISPLEQGCCGAVSQHLSAAEEAKQFIRHNIDVWWPFVEEGIEAIIVSASGCGVQVKAYAYLLRNDKNYAHKAKKISALTRDLSEVIAVEDLSLLKPALKHNQRIAFHSPCTLQHGQKINGLVEQILAELGYSLTGIENSHLCCGSAGTYSILQPELSQQLLGNKLEDLNAEQPDIIVTANVGCQLHLDTKSKIPVMHWVELLDISRVYFKIAHPQQYH